MATDSEDYTDDVSAPASSMAARAPHGRGAAARRPPAAAAAAPPPPRRAAAAAAPAPRLNSCTRRAPRRS
jgi:hypothetical protein